MSTFLNDTFTDTAGTLLSAHTSDSGATYVRDPDTTNYVNTAQITASGTIRPTATGKALYYANVTPVSADYTVSIVASVKSARANDEIAAAGRISSAAGSATCYLAYYAPGFGFTLIKVVAGAGAFLGSVYSGTLNDGDVIQLRMKGNLLLLLVNGVICCSANDSSITAAGFPGVYLGAATAATDTTGLHVTSASATNLRAIAVTDANWQHPPFNTYGDGTGVFGSNNVPAGSTVAALVCEGGSPASVTLSASSIVTLGLDVSRQVSTGLASANYPVLSYSLDNGPWTDFQLLSSTTALAFPCLNLRYTFKSAFCPATDTGPSKWNPTGTPAIPPHAIVLTGLAVDDGLTTVAQTLPAGGIDLFQGDSITEGLRVVSATDSATSGDGTVNFPGIVAAAFGSQYGQQGYGAVGYEQAGQGNTPVFSASSGLYFAGASRLDSSGHYMPLPDRIWIAHGTNGTTTQADVAAAITSARSRAPAARINLCVPPGGFARAVITAAVAACGDSNVFLLDAGTAFQVGLTGIIAGGTAKSVDGIHPNAVTHGKYGAVLTKLAAPASGGSAGGFFF